MMYECSKCRAVLPAEAFSKDRSKKNGLRGSCRACNRGRNAAWYAANKQKEQSRAREYMTARRRTLEGKKATRQAVRKWKAANPDAVQAAHERYRRRKGMRPAPPRQPRIAPADERMDRKHVRALQMIRNGQRPEMTSAELYRAKYRNNARFAMRERMRNQVRKATGRFGWVAHYFGHYTRRRMGVQLWQVLGYSVDTLRAHIGRQFTKGMSWERFDAGEIHIDHIVPKSSFSLDSLEDLRACFALSNLRPLWAKDNIKKRANAVFLI